MNKTYWIFPTSLIILLGSLAFWLNTTNHINTSATKLSPDEHELDIQQATLSQFSADGSLTYQIVAAQGWKLPMMHTLNLNQISIESFTPQNTRYRIIANNAFVTRDTVELDGSVKFIQQHISPTTQTTTITTPAPQMNQHNSITTTNQHTTYHTPY